MNFKSKRPYHGINFLLLAMQPYSCPYWATFRQINDADGTVKKGEHGTQISFWKMISCENIETEKEETVPFLRYYTVFNLEQTTLPIPPSDHEFEPVAMAEKIVAEMPSCPQITHNLSGKASYNPKTDIVTMPPKDTFESSSFYYKTLFHELVHSTGHFSRLGRFRADEKFSFGDDVYSEEELVAELGACFLRAESGISETFENSVAYIQGWLERLKNNRKLLVQAASRGSRAVEFIVNRLQE